MPICNLGLCVWAASGIPKADRVGVFQSAALGQGSEVVQVFMVTMADIDLVQLIHGPIHMGRGHSLDLMFALIVVL